MAGPYELALTGGNLQPGEQIIVKPGPMKGMTGEFIAQRSQKQLILRPESIGCSTIVDVGAAYI
jgi:hypothetical protein